MMALALTSAVPAFLTVDDEPAINWALGRLIGQLGLPVDHALSGQEALLLSRLRPYRVVFVDAKLPDISGLELASRLHELLDHPVVIMISGYFFDDDPLVEKALQTGLIQHFVAKPFLHRDILALIERTVATLRT